MRALLLALAAAGALTALVPPASAVCADAPGSDVYACVGILSYDVGDRNGTYADGSCSDITCASAFHEFSVYDQQGGAQYGAVWWDASSGSANACFSGEVLSDCVL
jgi:hypothetical protein